MKKLWDKIRCFADREVIATLNEPSTEVEILKLERGQNITLPEDVASYLLVHDGQSAGTKQFPILGKGMSLILAIYCNAVCHKD